MLATQTALFFLLGFYLSGREVPEGAPRTGGGRSDGTDGDTTSLPPRSGAPIENEDVDDEEPSDVLELFPVRSPRSLDDGGIERREGSAGARSSEIVGAPAGSESAGLAAADEMGSDDSPEEDDTARAVADADAALDALDDAVDAEPSAGAQLDKSMAAGGPAAGAEDSTATGGCVGWMCGRKAASTAARRSGDGLAGYEHFDRFDPRGFVEASTVGVVRESRRPGQLDVLTATLTNCSKKFKVGDRKDHKRSIASAFRELGLCETLKSDYDVRWGQQWDWGWEPDKREIMSRKDGDIVNNIPGFQDTVGEKLGLARMHMDCIERYGPHQAQSWCTYTKRAFNVGRFGSEVHFRYSEFRKHSKLVAAGQGVKYPLFWIIKKQQKSYGSHFMQIVALRKRDLTSTGDLARWIDINIPEGGWTIQEYIKYPLTYRQRKFDVRVWGMVTSVNPLRVYLLDAAFPKISTFAYNDSTAHLANPCMHVIMPLGEACIAFADQLIKPYPPSTRSKLFLEHIRGYRSKIAVQWQEMWAEEVWPQIAIKILMALVQSRTQPLKIDRRIKGAGRRYKRFLFLSPDFVIDANGGAFMVELNTNGFMIGDQYPELFTAQNETKAAMVMLGVTGYPRRAEYAAELREAVADFCSEVAPCDEEDQMALEELVHEERHLSNGWQRIFPSELFSKYWEALDHTNDLKGDNVFITAQDKLTESFIKTVWRPRHGGDQYVS